MAADITPLDVDLTSLRVWGAGAAGKTEKKQMTERDKDESETIVWLRALACCLKLWFKVQTFSSWEPPFPQESRWPLLTPPLGPLLVYKPIQTSRGQEASVSSSPMQAALRRFPFSKFNLSEIQDNNPGHRCSRGRSVRKWRKPMASEQTKGSVGKRKVSV